MAREAWRKVLGLLLLLLASVAGGAAESAPDFALRSADGPNVRLSEFRGQVVIIAFWSSRCSGCDRQVEYLDKLTGRLQDRGARLLVVSIDREPNAAMLRASRLEAPLLLDMEREVARLYDLGRLPVVHFVDHHGRLREVEMTNGRELAGYERALLVLLDE
ncbi:MAG: redoxin domain-containing protein [Gammaproteobacteria bacterium]|nr:redoxin domain-containing protein [Gammaproteobacteria bacterium]